MGNTTRRQPVNFAIPKAPAYKFMNVTNFNGLHMTDNPFITDNSTASDCLNVYVDETNTLTTRPRLELLSILSSKIDKNFKYINVYNLSDGYLIHGTLDNTPYMYKLKDDGDLKLIVGNYIPKDKCYIFEQDKKIFVLDGSKYLNIENDEIKEVEGYIPLRFSGKSETSSGVDLEDINLLTDKYRESYIWDLNSPVSIDDNNLVGVENNYFVKSDEITDVIRDDKILAVNGINIFSRSSFVNTYNKHALLWTELNGNYSQMNKRRYIQAKYDSADYYTDFDVPQNSTIRINADGSVIWVFYKENDTYYLDRLILNTDDSEFYNEPHYKRKSISNPFRLYEGESLQNIFVGNSDNLFCISTRKEGLEKLRIYRFKTGDDMPTEINCNSSAEDVRDLQIHSVSATDDSLVVVEKSYTYDNFEQNFTNKKTTISYYSGLSDTTSTISLNVVTTLDGLFESKITDSGYLLLNKNVYTDELCYIKTNIVVFKDYTSDEKLELTTKTISRDVFEMNDNFYLYTGNDLRMFDAFGVDEPLYLNLTFETAAEVKYSTNYILIYGASGGYNTLYRRNHSNEPNIVVTRTLDVSDQEYNSWYEKRNNFFKSKLNIRFENNIWFASENKLYFTRNNNPAYIPITSETVIGDDEHITGLSLVQDSVLVGYKKNNVFNITPTTFDGYVDYIVTVSKNTVGNTAFGGPIVTSLTETPVQITYDGIYALKQMTNVQSSDRISELISDNITMKWLKEKHDVIDNIQTINRSYWTYFVLKDYDVTKIYLLDNRYNTWYYWELSINTLNVFMKKDRVIVVDADGNIYKLEYSDKETEGDSSVTEYYDEVNVNTAIPWFWKSQILSLGTINHAKRLVDTTFIVSDTDLSDEYRLKYKFKVYRKMVSETSPTGTEIAGTLTYIQSVTKKTIVPKFNYIQLELSNIEGDLNNNKLRLIGLSLKYILLEGLV